MTYRTEGIKKTTSLAYLFGLSSQGIEVLFFFLMFKYFSVEDVGLFSWAMAIAAFFAVFMDFGQNMILVREFSQKKLSMQEAFYGTALLRLPFLVLGLLAVTLWLILYKPAIDRYFVVLVASMIQLLMMAEVFFKAWLRGNSRQNIANALDFCISVGRISVMLTLIFMLGKASALHLFSALLAMHVAIVAVSLIVTYREYQKIGVGCSPIVGLAAGAAAKKLLAPSLIFGFIAVLTVVQNRLDWLMVSHYISEVELARYSLANKFYEIFLIVFGISISTAFPWMCRAGEGTGNDSKLSLYLNLIIAAGMVAPLLIAFYAPWILDLLWGSKYQGSVPVVQLLMVAASIATIAGVGYYSTISRNGESKIMPVMAISTAMQVAVNFFLIPRYGSMGAAMGMLALCLTATTGYIWLLLVSDIQSSNQLKRWAAFEILVLLTFGVLMALGSNPALSSALLLTVGLAATYYILIPRNEKSLLLDQLGAIRYRQKEG